MLKKMLNFDGINWWMLVGGVGLNFIISLVSSFLGAYWALSPATQDFYQRYGSALMILGIFLATGLAGYMISKMSHDVPLKHALFSSFGALVPFFVAGLMSLNVMLLMLGLVAVAGNLNGGMLGLPKPHHFPERDGD